MKNKYLVVASGGIDSGLTMALLKLTGHDVTAIHFVYGQRSWLAELYSVYMLTKHYKIPLKVFDISTLYSEFGKSTSFLLNPNDPIYSGLKETKKSVSAWVPGRNMLFATITASYAESLMLNNTDIKTVYIASGWAQLSESGSYPDNSERFNHALETLFTFGLLKGHDIKMVNVLANIMKYEEWILGSQIGFPFEYTCSCDNPRVIWNSEVGDDLKNVKSYQELMSLVHDIDSLSYIIEGIELCEECGSTKNSRWAAKYAGVKDPRRFYKSNMSPKHYTSYVIDVIPKLWTREDLKSIIDRLQLDGKEKLYEMFERY